MGRLFGLCVQKGAELPDGDKRKKFKYRVVFQGNQVVTQNWEVALFQDLGSMLTHTVVRLDTAVNSVAEVLAQERV